MLDDYHHETYRSENLSAVETKKSLDDQEAIGSAIIAGDLSTVESLCNGGADPRDDGNHAIKLAAELGQLEIVKYLHSWYEKNHLSSFPNHLLDVLVSATPTDKYQVIGWVLTTFQISELVDANSCSNIQEFAKRMSIISKALNLWSY